MLNRFFGIYIGFYRRFYFTMAILSSLFIVIVASVAQWAKMNGISYRYEEAMTTAGLLSFTVVRFVIWYEIFSLLTGIFNSGKLQRVVLVKLSHLLFYSAALSVVSEVGYAIFPNGPSIPRWHLIEFPSIYQTLPDFLLSVFTLFCRISIDYSGFIAPATTRMASFFLGLIAYKISVSKYAED